MILKIITRKSFCLKVKHYEKLNNVKIDHLMNDLYEVLGTEENVKLFLKEAERYILRVEIIG